LVHAESIHYSSLFIPPADTILSGGGGGEAVPVGGEESYGTSGRLGKVGTFLCGDNNCRLYISATLSIFPFENNFSATRYNQALFEGKYIYKYISSVNEKSGPGWAQCLRSRQSCCSICVCCLFVRLKILILPGIDHVGLPDQRFPSREGAGGHYGLQYRVNFYVLQFLFYYYSLLC